MCDFYYIGDGVLSVSEENNKNLTRRLYYICADHQGSVVRIVDADGKSVFEASYDAWGRQTVTKNLIGFRRGYTGHEMLPEYALVNMNGRVYDPTLGRFLCPDPYVQMPDNSQNFNRYSYCLNNPLKYTDPTGELFGIDDFLFYSVLANAAMGAISAKMNGHNAWLGAIGGAVSTLAPYGVGQLLGHGLGTASTEFVRAGMHGLLNGGTNILQGDNFLSGFASGAVASAIGSGMEALNMGEGLVLGGMGFSGGLTSGLIDGDWLGGLTSGLNIGLGNHTYNDGDMINGGTLPNVTIMGQLRPHLPNIPQEKPLQAVYPELELLLGERALVNGAFSEVTNIGDFIKSEYDNFIYLSGGRKQWIRLGKSYSEAGGFKTDYSLRWGASFKYIKKIKSQDLRNLNKTIRTFKIPGNSWRVQDPGHLHLVKNKNAIYKIYRFLFKR